MHVLKRSVSHRKPRIIFSLTKDVHQRLPREVRDMIYTYLLTPSEMHSLSISNTLRLQDYSYPHDSTSKHKAAKVHRRHCLNLNKTYPQFATEYVEMFYEFYQCFWVPRPSDIPKFMGMDFFNINSTPADARLSTLHVSGCLDSDIDPIDLTTLASDFRILLDSKWAPKFDLDIAFSSQFAISRWDKSEIPILASRMHAIWTILKPWIHEVEKRGAEVYFVMLTKNKMYKYIKGECNMFDAEEQWRKDLELEIGYLGRNPEPRMRLARITSRGIETELQLKPRSRVHRGLRSAFKRLGLSS